MLGFYFHGLGRRGCDGRSPFLAGTAVTAPEGPSGWGGGALGSPSWSDKDNNEDNSNSHDRQCLDHHLQVLFLSEVGRGVVTKAMDVLGQVELGEEVGEEHASPGAPQSHISGEARTDRGGCHHTGPCSVVPERRSRKRLHHGRVTPPKRPCLGIHPESFLLPPAQSFSTFKVQFK